MLLSSQCLDRFWLFGRVKKGFNDIKDKAHPTCFMPQEKLARDCCYYWCILTCKQETKDVGWAKAGISWLISFN